MVKFNKKASLEPLLEMLLVIINHDRLTTISFLFFFFDTRLTTISYIKSNLHKIKLVFFFFFFFYMST
jgi:hypothetical protein